MAQTVYLAEGLYALALLACPVGLGLMMWLMMRGNKQTGGTQPGPGPSQTDAEVAKLRAELDQLRAAEQDRTTPPAESNWPH